MVSAHTFLLLSRFVGELYATRYAIIIFLWARYVFPKINETEEQNAQNVRTKYSDIWYLP